MTEAIVVDASFVCPLLLSDESSEESEALFTSAANTPAIILAPGVLYLEVLSALQQAVRRRRLSAGDLTARFEAMLELGIEVLDLAGPPLERARHCLALLGETGLTVYDATYLDMAISLDLPLATHDRALREAARLRGLLFNP